MDNEPKLTRNTKYPQQVKSYMSSLNTSEETARKLTARDLVIEKVVRSEKRLRALGVTDSLTGLFNKQWLLGNKDSSPPLKGFLQGAFELAERHRRKLVLVFGDLDFFKKYNDTFGHPEGDRALKIVGEIIKKTIRESDSAARYGGEEFVILLPETDLIGGIEVAERLRLTVEQNISFLRPMTLSLGIASYPFQDINTASKLLEAADKALYTAKQLGRNRVSIWTEETGLGLNQNTKM